ncbi:hypothetical protein [Peptoniphilus sp. HMSC062D09]|mgnify:CR=1 FL=1|uniref:hypothetical protein n=1 Tax=Peptoniphilus TaxID=162289 RepID=UPI0008A2EA9C|nr:hypothetical protein [Peptoniphilus sp. HMSC062D09]OFK79853.1 hypothetical protein HMPREF2801_07675 [Peptoniphilus sp. HMSC062D09]
MATISFTRKIEITEDQYEKMLNAKPTKELKKALEDYKKNPYQEVTDPQSIREILGEWGKK